MNYSQNQTLNSNKIFQGRQRDKLKISTNDVPWLNVRNDTCDLSRALQPSPPLPTKKGSYIHDYSYPVFVAVAIPTAGRARIRTRYLVPGKLPPR